MRAVDATTSLFPNRQDAATRRPTTSLAHRTRRVAQAVVQAIAAPPAHPLWSTTDATAQASVLPQRQLERLLAQGRLGPWR